MVGVLYQDALRWRENSVRIFCREEGIVACDAFAASEILAVLQYRPTCQKYGQRPFPYLLCLEIQEEKNAEQYKENYINRFINKGGHNNNSISHRQSGYIEQIPNKQQRDKYY
jgi:hypothetical protein